MGYADVVRQCKQIREAAKERLASEERLEQLHKGLPRFNYRKKDGDVASATLTFWVKYEDDPGLNLSGMCCNMSLPLAVAFAKWVIQEFDGIAEK